MQVTCAICKQKVDKKDAIPILNGAKNLYFCCEIHAKAYREEQRKKKEEEYDRQLNQLILEKGGEIFGYPIFQLKHWYTKMKEVTDIFPKEAVYSYIKSDEPRLTEIMRSRQFDSEMNKISYFLAIVKNHAGSYLPAKDYSSFYSTGGEIYADNYVRPVTKKTISEIEDEYVEKE